MWEIRVLSFCATAKFYSKQLSSNITSIVRTNWERTRKIVYIWASKFVFTQSIQLKAPCRKIDIPLRAGDILVLGTDGLFDNLFDRDIKVAIEKTKGIFVLE